MTLLLRRIFLWVILALLWAGTVTVISGCTAESPPNIDWATPVSGEKDAGAGEIQQLFDAYAASLVAKDRAAFLSLIDQESTAFLEQQAQMFDRLGEVPFAVYQIRVTSQSESAAGNVIAKVETAFTYRESFTGLPDPDRAAFTLVRRDSGWKISEDATEQALGKKRPAGLEDFGDVKALVDERVIVFYLPEQGQTAEQVAILTQSAFARLEEALPGVRLPKVPVRIFDNKGQIDRVFPGKWTEWTGGAARQLGARADQGGEIIIDSQTFNEVSGYDTAYNPKMLAHELTHIALFPLTGDRTPPFLIEGLADYVGGEENVVLLKQNLESGEAFSPTLRDLYQPGSFSALLTTEAAALAYEQSDTAVAFLGQRFGNEKVLQLLREFQRRGEEENDQDRLVDNVFREVLGVGWDEFESQWLRYVMGG